jgi:hypothetical protein
MFIIGFGRMRWAGDLAFRQEKSTIMAEPSTPDPTPEPPTPEPPTTPEPTPEPKKSGLPSLTDIEKAAEKGLSKVFDQRAVVNEPPKQDPEPNKDVDPPEPKKESLAQRWGF